MNFFDALSRPLPRFYELTIERRAEAIMVERNQVHLKRVGRGRRAFFLDVHRLSRLQDSVALLDVVSLSKSTALYQRILIGETYHG